jgi:hypothetical protein
LSAACFGVVSFAMFVNVEQKSLVVAPLGAPAAPVAAVDDEPPPHAAVAPVMTSRPAAASVLFPHMVFPSDV